MRDTVPGCHLNVKRVHSYGEIGRTCVRNAAQQRLTHNPNGGGAVWKDFLSNNCGINWNIRHESDINDSPLLIRTFSFNALLLKTRGGGGIQFRMELLPEDVPDLSGKTRSRRNVGRDQANASNYLVGGNNAAFQSCAPTGAALVCLR